jgi:molybdate transport system substrate-binding protein
VVTLSFRDATRMLMRLVLFLLVVAFTASAQAERVITVFAAASLTDAVTAAGKAYESKTGVRLRTSFASSSTLARQIEAGAGAQLYVSANADWMDYLEDRGLIVASSRRTPIGNALVLVAPSAAEPAPLVLSAETRINELLGPRDRLVLGDPDHVPAGLYAREALMSLGHWRALEGRLALSDNVRGALALVGRGEAALGIVYRTDALISKAVKSIATFPEATHRPIAYPFAIVTGHDGGDVRNLFDYLTGPKGVAVFESFGFVPN